jgi:Ni/Co efflux regulator RcnB
VLLLGPAPRGQRYVQINSDILLIASGTGLVVDAMIDFNW